MNEARSGLPEELELMAPGPELAAVLAAVDRDALSGKDRVRLLQARHRLAAHVQGEMYADMDAIRRAEPTDEPGINPIDDPEDPYPWASTEIAFALRWTHTLIAHGTTKVRPRPSTGTPGARRTRRRPTAEVAALVRARNRACAAPGCRVPSLRCELDHVLAWADGGESEPDNLDPACKRHHRFKHTPGADLVALNPGTFGWQTPLRSLAPAAGSVRPGEDAGSRCDTFGVAVRCCELRR